MARYNLDRSMSDMSNFDELAFRSACDKLDNWPAALSEADVESLAIDEFEIEEFDVDNVEHARVRWLAQWRRVFADAAKEATPKPRQLLMIPDGFTFPAETPDAHLAFDDNGGEPDGDLLLAPTENFTDEELEAIVRAGGEVVSGWSVAYRSPELINDAEPVDWCGYQRDEAYALSREVAQRIGDYCAH